MRSVEVLEFYLVIPLTQIPVVELQEHLLIRAVKTVVTAKHPQNAIHDFTNLTYSTGALDLLAGSCITSMLTIVKPVCSTRSFTERKVTGGSLARHAIRARNKNLSRLTLFKAVCWGLQQLTFREASKYDSSLVWLGVCLRRRGRRILRDRIKRLIRKRSMLPIFILERNVVPSIELLLRDREHII